jgi:hypothetical protein
MGDLQHFGIVTHGRLDGVRNPETEPDMRTDLARIEEQVRHRLIGLLRDFRLVPRDNGLVLLGHVHTYYAKQLAQHAVMEATSLPIHSNQMEVA